jgi:hypothetical protein
MGWSSRAGEIGASRWLGRSVAIFFVLAMAAPSPAQAQRPGPTPTPVPLPNSEISVAASLADLGSNFLERLGDQSTGGFGRVWRSNPGGGGASEAADGHYTAPGGRPMEPGPARSSTLSATGVRPRAALPE